MIAMRETPGFWSTSNLTASGYLVLTHAIYTNYPSTVPVPSHWNAKRDYLAGKRGIEKPPYLLPCT